MVTAKRDKLWKYQRFYTMIVHIFTMNGSHKELPLLLQGLISVVGRDIHFIGDSNKLKALWYENIRLMDLTNFFEDNLYRLYLNIGLRVLWRDILD